ncbi:meiotically up-regulated protein [Apiospora rasikravindrae]|uniref:Meiotically up-regulated protein n=1 Tax=Apiospora rasikravindrae TaxID=990691 RepID=A0ABR1U087_9PEZI
MAEIFRSSKPAYTARRPVPTINSYVREQQERSAQALSPEDDEDFSDDEETQLDDDDEGPGPNETATKDGAALGTATSNDAQSVVTKDTSEAVDSQQANLKRRRKDFGKRRKLRRRREREVTDPVTHLPVRIYDFQASDLAEVPDSLITLGAKSGRLTGVAGKSKSDDDLERETEDIDAYHAQLDTRFPPPDYEAVKQRLIGIYSKSIVIGLTSAVVIAYAVSVAEGVLGSRSGFLPFASEAAIGSFGFLGIAYAIYAARQWMSNRVDDIWEEELWRAEKNKDGLEDEATIGARSIADIDPASTRWLNDMLSSLWPLVNPDLFFGVADTLEDVMQASIPSIVRMVSIEDIGQGGEPVNILGIKWLPTGAAMNTISKLAGGGGKGAQDWGEDAREGLQGEEGDFLNLEVAFAYRPQSVVSDEARLQGRSQNAHLVMGFYLPGRIKLPIHAHLKALVGKARLRLTLIPDPPFFSSVTMMLLGQPKVEIACMPLVQKGLNIMDLPLISSFVQTSVDAAVAEYVAPKSITVPLKDILAGRDFKLDPRARGIIVIHVKRAYSFKQGDQAIPLLRPEGSSDPYVTCGWAKYVKPLWSTRVLLAEMQPYWDETAFLPVTDDELNINERLRVQLWDSDRFTADDDLGRVEMDLRDLMRDPATVNRMQDRVDGFKALKASERMPGKLEWSVGYYPKIPIQAAQLAQQTELPELRGGPKIDDVEGTRQAEYKEMEDRMVASAPPLPDFPSGVLAVQIHEATGLEIRAHHNADRRNQGTEVDDEVEEGEELPSAYCNIILNHEKIYRTRVKPKNARPFFNASTERFVRDWRAAEIFISVRDSRVHEDDSLMGLVYLPLRDVFRERAQVDRVYPLFGGMGYGRLRVSMVFRSVGVHLPQPMLGWEYGTLAVGPRVGAQDVSAELQGLTMKLDTSLSSGHMYYNKPPSSQSAANGPIGDEAHHQPFWSTAQGKMLHLGVRKRYSSPLVIQFRKERRLRVVESKTAVAYAVLWLSELPDDEDTTVTLNVWKGDLKRASTCTLPKEGAGDEKVGQISLRVRFRRGVGKAHAGLAHRDPHVANVIEVVETAAYQLRKEHLEAEGVVRSAAKAQTEGVAANGVPPKSSSGKSANTEGTAVESTSEDSDDNDDDNNDDDGFADAKSNIEDGDNAGDIGSDENEDDKYLQDASNGGMRDALRDYRSHAKQTHRRHRGVMQFKSARTLWWMKHKVGYLQDRVSGKLEHGDRKTVVESEV